MKKCSAVSPLTGLYMEYAFIVGVKNKTAYMCCYDLEGVRSACNYFRKEFPRANLYARRFLVVADVDTQMRKRAIRKILTTLKSMNSER